MTDVLNLCKWSRASTVDDAQRELTRVLAETEAHEDTLDVDVMSW